MFNWEMFHDWISYFFSQYIIYFYEENFKLYEILEDLVSLEKNYFKKILRGQNESVKGCNPSKEL